MADLTSRPDSWMDYLPGNWQQAINTNPLLNALGRATSRPTPDLTRGIEYDQHGSVSDRNWLLEQARGGPPKMSPLAAEMLDKGGLLANFLGPGVKLPAVAPKPTGIRAYHGSPHDFDKFDISKIGTGEGAQAYGRGLYFAESEGVAKSYRDDLAGFDWSANIPKREVNGGDIRYAVEEALKQANGNPARARQILEQERKHWAGMGEDGYGAEAIKLFDEIAPTLAPKPKGRMYEVNIKADPDQFLDWDLPLAQQPERVRRALEAANLVPWKTRNPLGIEYGNLSKESALALSSRGQRPIEPDLGATGGDLLNWEVGAGRPVAKQENSDRLRDAGIPGIKYLDQQSRAAGQGSRNFVVFDENLIEILRKYGLLPPVAAGTAAALNQQEPQQ